jgi:putative multiple sugar transport system permease protein
MLFFRGLNQFIGKSNTIPVPPEFQVIGAGSLPEVGPTTGYNNLTVLLGLLGCALIVVGTLRNRAKLTRINAEVEESGVMWARLILICAVIMGVMLLIASGAKGFPVSGLILVALVIVYGFLTSKTILGRHIYAVGGNRHAAELSGVKTKKIDFLVMMNMSMLAALAGMMFVARSTSSGPFDGVGWELDAIAAVFIGGAAVSGGVGTVVGSMIGGLVMAVLNNGLQLKGIGADMTQIIKGLVLLIAVAFDVFQKSQGRPSLIGRLTRSKPADASPAVPTDLGRETSVDQVVRTES